MIVGLEMVLGRNLTRPWMETYEQTSRLLHRVTTYVNAKCSCRSYIGDDEGKAEQPISRLSRAL